MNKYAYALGLLLFITAPAHAQTRSGALAIGLNATGAHTRYFLSPRIAAEIKAQYDGEILVGGGRFYYYFNPLSRCLFYTGIEGDYLTAKRKNSTSDLQASGIAGEVFLGMEYFVKQKFSVQADLGPAYIKLTDDSGERSADGLEYVVHFALNYYFGSSP